MRTRRPSAAHQQAVAARLARLSEEIAAARDPDLGHTRVRPTLVEEDPPPVVEKGRSPVSRPLPTVVEGGRSPVSRPLPTPGRHASRRAAPALLAPLSGRVALTGPHAVVLLVLVVVGLVVTCWWLVRSTPIPVAATPAAAPASPLATDLVELVSAPGAPAPSEGPTGTQAPGEVTVDVAGDVRRPGIVVLPVGARVVDALEAAGGARGSVDLTALNLARPLVDGEQVLVGAPAPVAAAAPGTTPAPAPGTPVDLNTADEALLDTLPGVGPVTAAAILAWRAEHGRFTVVEELLEVDGIGDATLAELAPLVTV